MGEMEGGRRYGYAKRNGLISVLVVSQAIACMHPLSLTSQPPHRPNFQLPTFNCASFSLHQHFALGDPFVNPGKPCYLQDFKSNLDIRPFF